MRSCPLPAALLRCQRTSPQPPHPHPGARPLTSLGLGAPRTPGLRSAVPKRAGSGGPWGLLALFLPKCSPGQCFPTSPVWVGVGDEGLPAGPGAGDRLQVLPHTPQRGHGRLRARLIKCGQQPPTPCVSVPDPGEPHPGRPCGPCTHSHCLVLGVGLLDGRGPPACTGQQGSPGGGLHAAAEGPQVLLTHPWRMLWVLCLCAPAPDLGVLPQPQGRGLPQGCPEMELSPIFPLRSVPILFLKASSLSVTRGFCE